MLKNSKGFTLIELLVVVAIIGILASVVLSSLNTARVKGIDVAIKSAMANARAQAGLYYDPAETYTGVCAATGQDVIGPMVLNALQKLNPAAVDTDVVTTLSTDYVYDANGASGSAVCHVSANGKNWAAIVSLRAPTIPNGGWCVDSAGVSREVATLPGGISACP